MQLCTRVTKPVIIYICSMGGCTSLHGQPKAETHWRDPVLNTDNSFQVSALYKISNEIKHGRLLQL